MFGLLHLAEGSLGLLNRVEARLHRRECTSRKVIHERVQQATHLHPPWRSGDIDMDKMVGHIRTEGINFLGAPDIALGDLDKAPIGGQNRQPLLNKTGAGERVKDNVNPTTSSISQNLVGKVKGPRIVNMLNAQRVEGRPLARTGGSINRRPHRLRHLHRGHAGAASRRMNQNRIGGFDLSQFM